jgi:hypothetical protein
MDKKTLSVRHVEDNKHSLGDAVQQALKAELMACHLIDRQEGESMSGRKKPGKEVSIIRSSAAEYLTFIAASGTSGIDAVYADENIWLTQKMMGVLYDVDVRTINYHLKKIFSDSELQEDFSYPKFSDNCHRITGPMPKNRIWG